MALPDQTSLLRRLLVGVALLGIVLVTHLALQKAGGFQNGCTGFGDVDYSASAQTTGETSGCATVTEGEYADFLGVSNVIWGLLFYVLVTLLRLGYVVVRDDRLRLAAFGVVAAGFLYTLRLVYLQAFEIQHYCVLCMTSAALVLTLLVLHVIEHRRLNTAPDSPEPSPRRRAAEPTGLSRLRPYATILGGFAVLLFGAFAIAPERAEEPAPATSVFPTSETGPTRIEQVTGACTFDPGYEAIEDLSPFTTGPYLGSAEADVVVVEVVDPNCPHCRELSETMDGVIESNLNNARFYYVPYPLRQQSLGQIIALKVAQKDGHFFDLLHEMFRRQDQTWGMTLPELIETANAVGMDGAALEGLLNDQTQLQPILAQIQAEAEAVNAVFTSPEGNMSVPKLAINGSVVEPTYSSYSDRCLNQFIAEANQ